VGELSHWLILNYPGGDDHRFPAFPRDLLPAHPEFGCRLSSHNLSYGGAPCPVCWSSAATMEA